MYVVIAKVFAAGYSRVHGVFVCLCACRATNPKHLHNSSVHCSEKLFVLRMKRKMVKPRYLLKILLFCVHDNQKRFVANEVVLTRTIP